MSDTKGRGREKVALAWCQADQCFGVFAVEVFIRQEIDVPPIKPFE